MRTYLILASTLLVTGIAQAQQSAPPEKEKAPPVNLAEFRTVDTAVKATVKSVKAKASGQAGYFGVLFADDKKGKLAITDIAADSPAAKAGFQSGDVIRSVDGKSFRSSEELRQWLRSRSAGDTIKVDYDRHGKKSADVTLAGLSRPKSMEGPKAYLGLSFGEESVEEGVQISFVSPASPASTAGLRAGDVLAKINGSTVTGATRAADMVGERVPGEVLMLTVRRGMEELDYKVTLTEDRTQVQGQGGQGLGRPGGAWKKDVFKLALIGIEYPDVKHNDKVKESDWEESVFSKGTFINKYNATGQTVYGSVNDHYQEMSVGKLKIEGKMFPWIQVSKNRMDYSQGNGTGGPNRLALLTEAMDLITKRDGEKALDDYDGVFFIYAGGRVNTNRGAIYWPHRSTVRYKTRGLPYFIVQEGGARMTNISVMSHEFGHMVGLPDLYARPENPGSEGLGNWCLMSNQVNNGRPQHMGAWCKVEMGWLTPTAIDPTVPQKLVLSPVEGSTKECFKVLLRPDGYEYLLIENRKKTGFDESLPADGLLIWRIVGRKVILEESHGVDGPAGPGVFRNLVPYPSESNDSYTPYTTPSSRSQLGGGLPVYITNIRKLPDGKVSFYVGYEFD
jgi:M6 family metalloprotease-like protein